MKSPVFKSLLGKRNRVERTKKEKSRDRNSKAARKEKRKEVE